MVAVLLVPGAAFAQGKGKEKDAANPSKADREKTEKDGSYAIGLSFARGMNQDGISDADLSVEDLIQGIRDGLEGKKLDAERENEIRAAHSYFFQQLERRNAKRRREDGERFLKENKGKEGVKTFENGLQYKVIKSGKGKTPRLQDEVEANYKGSFINGQIFDQTTPDEGPARFNVNRVIEGWTTALTKMKEGDVWELFVPSDLAYGEKGREGIPPNSMLIFEIELVKVIPAESAPKRPGKNK